MSTQNLISIIEQKHLLKHPFYQAWTNGTLPLEVMQKYAIQYYHLELNFPKFLSMMHGVTDDFAARQAITENLYDEEAGEKNHRELWLRYCESIGINRNDVINSQPTDQTKAVIESFKQLCSSSMLEGSAALAAYESQMPEIAKTKVEGLKKHYSITDSRGTEFFDLHGILDVKHADVWWAIINEHACSNEDQSQVENAVTAGRDALWSFLDGVLEVYWPECPCEVAQV